ncbi:MAG: 2Fe-2S iron-sulfur cluster-binding protein [Anderseniella sp.]
MDEFHQLTIAAIRPQTAFAKVVRFELPEELKEAFTFKPGQYLTVQAMLNGEKVRRSYSICCTPDEGLEIGVKHQPGGVFSSFVQTLKPGDTLEVMAPKGRFVADIGGNHTYLLIAAGSGITPVLSIVKSVLKSEPSSTVTLVYSNRSFDSVMFREELNDIKDTHMTRLNLLHVMTEEGQDVDVLSGRIDAEKLSEMAHRRLIDPAASDAVYLCGPAPMIKDLRKGLTEMGVGADKIRFEIFTPTPYGQKSGDHPRTRAKVAGAEVEIILDGARKKLRVDPAVETVLDAAKGVGVDIPYSCAGGMCCTCRCKVLEGSASMDENWSLEPWELEAGYILACQARPETEKLVLDFDAH